MSIEKKEGTRELPSALVRAVVAPWDLAVSKFPAILDRYSRFSDARVFDFSFFSVLISPARYLGFLPKPLHRKIDTKKRFSAFALRL